MSLQVQFVTLLSMLIGGQVLGIVFDVYRVIANVLRFRNWMKALFDILFWAAATLFIFRLLYWSNYGEIRVYVFVALVAGVWLYFLWFSRSVIAFVRWCVEVVKKTIRLFLRIADIMIIRPIKALYRLSIALAGFLAAVSIFLGRLVIQCLYPFWRLFRWATKPLWRHWRTPGWMIMTIRATARTVGKARRWFADVFRRKQDPRR